MNSVGSLVTAVEDSSQTHIAGASLTAISNIHNSLKAFKRAEL
jgi:hypothetical protein